MSKSVFATNKDHFQAIYPGACQRVTVSGTSAQSASVSVTSAFSTSIVELFATTDCWVRFGADPTAAVNDGSSFFLGSGMFKYYGIDAGQKIAVIQDSAGGYLHIIEGKF